MMYVCMHVCNRHQQILLCDPQYIVALFNLNYLRFQLFQSS